MAEVTLVRPLPDTAFANGPTNAVEDWVEAGEVLAFDRLAFALQPGEQRFLDERWSDGKAKNISLRWPAGELRGAAGSADDLRLLHGLLLRFATDAEALVLRLFPHYRGALRRGNTSLRNAEIAGRVTSWRQDDSRLHVDAFPSNPMLGARLLRVFTNVNPHGEPRRWRVGEPFEQHARRYLGLLRRQLPGQARLLAALGITKRRRSDYDHLMLQLHDFAKADTEFQRESPQQRVDFAPGTTWVVYSDQVLHAALGGRNMFEQTFVLDVDQQKRPETSPLRTLERLTRRTLR